ARRAGVQHGADDAEDAGGAGVRQARGGGAGVSVAPAGGAIGGGGECREAAEGKAGSRLAGAGADAAGVEARTHHGAAGGDAPAAERAARAGRWAMMIVVAWAVYCVLIAALLTLGAAAWERSARWSGGAARWGWLAAAAGSVTLPWLVRLVPER